MEHELKQHDQTSALEVTTHGCDRSLPGFKWFQPSVQPDLAVASQRARPSQCPWWPVGRLPNKDGVQSFCCFNKNLEVQIFHFNMFQNYGFLIFWVVLKHAVSKKNDSQNFKQ